MMLTLDMWDYRKLGRLAHGHSEPCRKTASAPPRILPTAPLLHFAASPILPRSRVARRRSEPAAFATMAPTMRALEIHVNGKRVCTAGIGDAGVLTAIVRSNL